jgi:hypothetical protein
VKGRMAIYQGWGPNIFNRKMSITEEGREEQERYLLDVVDVAPVVGMGVVGRKCPKDPEREGEAELTTHRLVAEEEEALLVVLAR